MTRYTVVIQPLKPYSEELIRTVEADWAMAARANALEGIYGRGAWFQEDSGLRDGYGVVVARDGYVLTGLVSIAITRGVAA